MARSTDITSFSEHRQHLRDHLEKVRKTGRPLYITTNGQTDAVLLSPEAFDALAEKAEMVDAYQEVQKSMADIRAGRTFPAKEAIEQIARDLGLDLDR